MTDEYDRMMARRSREEHLGRLGKRGRVPQADRELLVQGELAATAPLASVQGWYHSKTAGPVLCLSGSVGIGKTIAATWAIADGGGVYLHASEACRQWAAKYDRLRYEDLASWRMVVIDDVGLEADADVMTDLLICACDTRDGRRARMILTTNLNEQQLRSRYPEPRLWSRMTRLWHCVTKTGNDMRDGGRRL